MHVFDSATIGGVSVGNRILRSATFEGLCNQNGVPGADYTDFYTHLSKQGLGGIITGFAYVSRDGRAMQPGQAGIESDDKVVCFSKMTGAVHENAGKIFLQIAHAGRQTSPDATGCGVHAPSDLKSPYFNYRPRRLTEREIEVVIKCFAEAARRAQAANFDGVQLHAAHGYLIHQFLHPAINDRTDTYGVDPVSGLGIAFLDRVITAVRTACGADFPLLIKISAGDNLHPALGEREFIELIRFLDARALDAIEISFGTMDYAFNIFRGDTIPMKAVLDFNPRFGTKNKLKRALWKAFVFPLLKRQITPFTPMYNLPYARLAKRHTTIPIISVGGFRSGSQIHDAIEKDGIDFVSLCRPILCEPDFVLKIRQDPLYQSRCSNCNRCAVMCDSEFSTRCYGRKSISSTPPDSEVSKLTSNFYAS